MDLLCQLQADQLGVTVQRPADQETTAVSPVGSVGWQRAVDLDERHESGSTGDAPLEWLWVNIKD